MDSMQAITLLRIDDYQVHLKLGDGGQSAYIFLQFRVFLVEKDQNFYAAKVFKALSSFNKEISTMTSLKSSNIVQLIEGLP